MNGLIFVQFETLTLNKDFRRLYGRGRSFVHPALVTYVSKNRLGYPRIGITTGKKLGKAVERNRARRLIRAAWYDCLPEVTCGVDIVFVARTRTLSSKSTYIAKSMRQHLVSAGIIHLGNNNEAPVN
ncbi:MAG: ribonuclease P protein component [Oscillospiraceae bacterium]|nr:ribonuclease P protein component [Oscillospiraceae bacterium]